MNVKLTTFLAVMAAFAVTEAGAAVSSRSYVQRGLAAQYDGIDNAGRGAHDASAKVWKDLTGNGNDGACDSALSWSADGWSVSTNCKPVTVPAPGLARTLGTGTFTIQFACTPSIDNKRQAFFSQYNYTSAYGGLGLEHNSGGNKTGKLRYYKFMSVSGNTLNDQLDYLTGATIPAGAFTSASVAMSPTTQKCWLNGTLADTRTGSLKAISSSCTSVIGGEPQAGSSRTGGDYTAGYGITFQGEYNAFRVYDRTLTEDEAKVNAAVDAIRFNGASPGDFALGGGWSFDGSGDLCVEVTASASGDGSVSGSATVKQYGTATLIATPASGAVFKRWTGDTDAISSGSVFDATVTVTATEPSTLMAVFMTPTSGLNASSYVRRGLVANFDGIDNAGTGSHDSSAATWTDLTGNGNDATVGANASWNGTDGWTSSTDGKPMTIPAGNGSATTVAGTTAKKVFTAQFTVKPSRHNARQSFFGQWDRKGVCIEHNSGDSGKPGYIRAFYNFLSGTTGDDKFSSVLVTSGEWAAMSLVSDTAQQTVWKNGETSQTIVKSLSGTLTNICASVIGGDNTRDNMGYRGTYNAFRLYNRLLSENEVKVNAVLDDRRFNNGAKGLALPAGWSFDANGTLMVDVSATATTGGMVSYRGGAAAASASDTVNHDGSTIVSFAAIPDAGYVFDRWSGDTDLIASGSILTPEITLDPDRAISLVANFCRNGDADDGKVFDLSFSGDATTDGMTFSTTEATETQGYVTEDVTLPVLPTVTNANVSCLYLPQPTNVDGTGTYRQMAVSDKPAVTGEVATVFVRFRWDGPVLPTVANYPDVLLNGYTSWSAMGRGFIVRLFSAANSTDAYPGFVFPQCVVDGNSTDIENVSESGVVKPGEWIDLFASVYPSPTNPEYSNADIWYCRVPAWNSDGYFPASAVGHRHYGDILRIPRMDTISTTLQFGTEPSVYAGVSSDASKSKVFRGAIAAAKGWNRMLSENEMWTVMADIGGLQSFTDLTTSASCTYTTDYLNTDYFKEGRNGTQTSFLGGDDPAAHRWRALTQACKSNTLLWDAPKDVAPMPVVYSTKIANVASGKTQPIHLEVNGTKVWPVDTDSKEVAKGEEIKVEIGAEYTYSGLNELKWVYDTVETSNWMIFDHHKLKLVTPANPFVMVVR